MRSEDFKIIEPLKPKIMLFKIEWMTSKEIAGLTGKSIKHINRDIRVMLKELSPKLDLDYKTNTYKDSTGKSNKFYLLNKRLTYVLVTGYSSTLRDSVINRWLHLEEQLHILKYYKDDRQKQMDAMAELQYLLPEDLKNERKSYSDGNRCVNKATSNYFGFSKMIVKAQMSIDMLEVRKRVMKDYLSLYEVLGDNDTVKPILYKKYQQLLIAA